jgi:hypothetical protein
MRSVCIAAIAAALTLLPASSAPAKYNPTAFHPFDFSTPYPCPLDVVGTDGPEQLEGGARPEAADGLGVLGLGGDDTLVAAEHGDCLRGGAGNDRIFGGPAQDSIDGDDGDDRISAGDGGDGVDGGFGADVIDGGNGSDSLDGEAGPDTIRGGPGNDWIHGGPERNRIDAGPGSDTISSVNGIAETVRCGSGRDLIWADRHDRLVGCEHVHLVRDPFPAVTPRVGTPTTVFHLSYRAPFSIDDPCDCAFYDADLTVHPAGGGCGRVDIGADVDPVYGRRLVWLVTSGRRRGFCSGVYRGEVSWRWEDADNCQTAREAAGRDDACDGVVGLGSFSFRVR